MPGILNSILPFLVLFFLTSFSWAETEQSVAPGINDAYQDADPQFWQDIFESERREIWARRNEIADALKLQPGMSVADVGAGTGFFSLMFAKTVGPQGHVYAVDIQPNFIESIEQRAKESGLGHVTGIVNTERTVGLNKESVDLVFISDTYHHFEYPVSTLADIHAAIKPGGDLVVIDFKRIPGFSSAWVIDHVRAGEETVRREIEQAGFKFIESWDFMQTQFFHRYRKQ